ncbi:methyltransferase [Saccharomonospora xinjiangensis]|uniref:methyltransferase n=1 Tax=Saccharomonospora xinjiangensis TaxID=75294 RepID=UPI0035109167
MNDALLDRLPPPLPADHIVALNQPRKDLHTERRYEWNGWTFDVPAGVFLPGATSRVIHQRLLDGRIDVRGRRYAAMGVGLGVEAVVAGRRGAKEIYAIDVHPLSVDTTTRHYERLVGHREGTTFVPVVADVFDGFPTGRRIDVITFNPPAVSQKVSEDPDIVRNVCVGATLVERFFTGIVEHDVLAPGGEVFLIASNTADLRTIVSDAVALRFRPQIRLRHDWRDGVLTYLFRFTREGGDA